MYWGICGSVHRSKFCDSSLESADYIKLKNNNNDISLLILQYIISAARQLFHPSLNLTQLIATIPIANAAKEQHCNNLSGSSISKYVLMHKA